MVQIIVLKISVDSIEHVERIWLEQLEKLCSRKEIHVVYRSFIQKLISYQPFEQLDAITERALNRYINLRMQCKISASIKDIAFLL